MLKRLWHLLRPPGETVRGRPHFVAPADQRHGVVAWIAEGRAVIRGGQRVVVPTAIIELHTSGVRRRRLGLLHRLLTQRRKDAADAP